ncbi:MAG TPA: hypothetical protein VFV33_04140 [Gemmatimonadaceae bacterium]|nr:hypothetical protein [Gemmatimonadaceae bacterium]
MNCATGSTDMMHVWRQRLLMLAAALLSGSATIVAFLVIPLVAADTFPGASPERAVPAFWGHVGLVRLVAAAALTASRLGPARARLRRVLAGAAALLALVLGLLLVDAAMAFRGHGSGMYTAVVALWVCVGLDVAAGIALAVSALARQD